jgi:hypothetical protein
LRVGRASHGTFGVGVTVLGVAGVTGVLGNIFARGTIHLAGGFSLYGQMMLAFGTGNGVLIVPNIGFAYSWW